MRSDGTCGRVADQQVTVSLSTAKSTTRCAAGQSDKQPPLKAGLCTNMGSFSVVVETGGYKAGQNLTVLVYGNSKCGGVSPRARLCDVTASACCDFICESFHTHSTPPAALCGVFLARDLTHA